MHYRPNGKLARGYYCARCGAPGVNMLADGHGIGKCQTNQRLVAELSWANDGQRDQKAEQLLRAKTQAILKAAIR